MGTAFVLNVNNSISRPDAPQVFPPEGCYAIKIDLYEVAEEDLTYRLAFGERDALAGRGGAPIASIVVVRSRPVDRCYSWALLPSRC